MTVATVKTVAARFLKSVKPEVLALKGAWGVGKTYAWNKLVLDYRNETVSYTHLDVYKRQLGICAEAS